ncbi:metal-dependent transcriptional regulator [Pyrobaculum sp.]|uniref:metal-dependent transcriptional regulator n=1 Tax=Pyrobaculum sp. TaxID=2004705 RepID=UPI003D0A72BC
MGHELLRYRPEHYLEALHQLGGRASLSALAREVGVKPSTARKMVLYLQAEGLVEYRGRGGVLLTEAGRARVEYLDKIHSSLADFFKTIGVEEELAESEAEKLEHVIDPRVVERLAAVAQLLKSLKALCGR